MVKAGKECKGFSPDDEETEDKLQLDRQEKLDRFVVLLQAVYRGWKTRKESRGRKLSVPSTPSEQDDARICTLPSADNTRDAALQYVFDHRILELFKNLLSRLFYTKPESVREFLMNELLKIDGERHLADAAAAAKDDSTLLSGSLQIPKSGGAERKLGIFNRCDFPVYFNLLAGGRAENIPARQLLHCKKP